MFTESFKHRIVENISHLRQRYQSIAGKLQVIFQRKNYFFNISVHSIKSSLKWNGFCKSAENDLKIWFFYFDFFSREKMAQAYEFALNNMGMDFASSSIYNDYIMFVKNFDAAGSSYAENQKISAIRRIYHRGVIIPMLNVENLWYENEFNLKSISNTLKSLPFTFYSFLRLIAFD